ncbi:hypothetical protein [Streptomyces mirabilis]|uniref:hypothetical protein n=1 Tax=Streptomyces mirabilis TaxID=68239 RepID=UPI0036DD885C
MSARCGTGHGVVTAVGSRALLVVVADEGLDLAARSAAGSRRSWRNSPGTSTPT